METIINQTLDAAKALLDKGNVDDAWQTISPLVKDSTSLELLETAAICATKMCNYQLVINILQKAISIQPDCARLHNNIANAYCKILDINQALQHLSFAITIEPSYAEAFNNIARIYYQTGKIDKAIEFYAKATRMRPNYYEAHYNLALALSKKERYFQAISHYLQSGVFLKENPNTWLNLGLCYFAIDEYKKSLQYLERYCNFDPQHEQAVIHLASAYLYINEFNQSLAWFKKASEINPKNAEVQHNLGILHLKQKNSKESLFHFKQALTLNPSNATAQHMVAALTSTHINSASNQYIISLFQQYAPYYDSHMQQELAYQVPMILREEIGHIIQKFHIKINNVLDLGCGTGLCGLVFRDLAKYFIGVDLCYPMLAYAKHKKIYDGLINADLKNFMPSMETDLVIAAEVFNYCGDLSNIFDNIYNYMSNNSIFVFTTEIRESGNFSLQKSGRFAHSKEYIESLAIRAGFEVYLFKRIQIRKHNEGNLNGNIFILRKNIVTVDPN